MKYGNYGRDLILELKRSQQQNQQPSSTEEPITLPAYNDRLVRNCLQDLQLHVQALQDQVEANASLTEKPPTAVRPSILLQKAAISRNKRCLLTYHQSRISTITRAYWESADDLLSSSNLSPAEQEFATEYERLVQHYTMASGLSDDLRASRHPTQPVDKVLVRVLQGTEGPIVLESGATVDFIEGAVHYLLFTDVEPFIRDGTLERLTAEEDGNQNPLSGAAT
ncbi:hypothetical protein ACA910_016427 [Epithemia clementina (nom. ined.)]